jgi:hypothetical protein
VSNLLRSKLLLGFLKGLGEGGFWESQDASMNYIDMSSKMPTNAKIQVIGFFL